jgi:hypothetical protein
MSTRSDSSAQDNTKLQRLTAEALRADKAALAAKQKADRAKARLKAAKKQAKAAKAELKIARKMARKAFKKAKAAKKALQLCLDRAAKQRKKTRKRVAAPKSGARNHKSAALAKREQVAALPLPSGKAE